MSDNNPSMEREKKTIESMIGIYCQGHHGNKKNLCSECSELLDYAFARLDKCPYKEDKPTCSKCPSHCYKPDMKERVKTVMRYSGPRMMIKHPVLAAHHMVDGRKKGPTDTGSKDSKTVE